MITITDKPYDYTPVGQKLMVCMTSTNYLNAGFRFILNIPSIDVTLYLQPNPSGTGMLDLCPILRERLRHTALANEYNINEEYSAHFSDEITIVEGWLVGGIFTENPDGIKPARFKISVFLANYEISDGYKPDPNVRYALNDDNDYLLSERTERTHSWQRASEFGLDDSCIYIPVREEDWGIIMSIIYCPSQLNTYATNLYILYYNNTGSVIGATNYTLDSGAPTHNNYIGIYPQNLDMDGELPTNWYYYILQAINNVGKYSRKYVFYKVASDCRFDNVRLMWTNTCGGVDYFNFNKKNEVNYTLDRKQYTQVIGSYASTDFGFNTHDRGITDRMVIATKGMVINSDWLSVGEFELLKTLLISNDVYIVNDDDGTQVPVIVDESSFVIKDDRYSRLFNLTIKLKFSQPVGI